MRDRFERYIDNKDCNESKRDGNSLHFYVPNKPNAAQDSSSEDSVILTDQKEFQDSLTKTQK